MVVAAAAGAGGGGGGRSSSSSRSSRSSRSSNRIGLSYWHLLWRDWVRVWIGYGTGMDRGMDRDTLSGPAFTLWLWRKRAGYFKSSLVLHVPDKAETEGVVIIAPLEVQEAPSGTRTSLTSLQGALAILLVATQLLAFVQLPEAHGGSEPAPAARAGPAGAAAEAAAAAAAAARKQRRQRRQRKQQ